MLSVQCPGDGDLPSSLSNGFSSMELNSANPLSKQHQIFKGFSLGRTVHILDLAGQWLQWTRTWPGLVG